MSDSVPQTQKQLAVRIAATANAAEREAIRIWIQRLLSINQSGLPVVQKAKHAIAVTAESQVVWPSVKMIAREMKRFAWDDRSVKIRFGLGGAAIAALAFGGQGAGIAALGTAVGVPLWVVFGAGATFLGVLYEEIVRPRDDDKSTSQMIDSDDDDASSA